MNRIKNLTLNKERAQRKAVFLLMVFEFLSLSMSLIYNIEHIKNVDFITYLAILLATFLSTFLINKVIKSDGILLMIVNMLFSIGVAVIYRLDPSLGRKQLQYYLVGLFMFFVTYRIMKSYNAWRLFYLRF